MNRKNLEALARKYGNYAVLVDEEKKTIMSFTDSINLSAPDFLTFTPLYRIPLGSSSGVAMEHQVLTFPSRNVERIISYVLK